MADGEDKVGNPSPHDLTITEDHNSSTKEELNTTTDQESIEPYKNGFGLTEYYKFCLKYYHKGKITDVEVESRNDMFYNVLDCTR